MSTKDVQSGLVSNMRKWQKIEDASVSSTGQMIEKTENPLLRLVMEIIQRDSQMHYRVQEFIADSIEHKAVSLTPDELVAVWGMIVQEYMLNYLLEDEKKHNVLLQNLEDIKKGIYRSV